MVAAFRDSLFTAETVIDLVTLLGGHETHSERVSKDALFLVQLKAYVISSLPYTR